MADPNLKTLDGVITYSIISGFLLAILISTGLDVSETAILITALEGVANALGYDPILIAVIGIGATIIDLIITFVYVTQIALHGKTGAVVSGLGFFGSLLLFLGETQVVIIGVFVIMAGYTIIRFVEE